MKARFIKFFKVLRKDRLAFLVEPPVVVHPVHPGVHKAPEPLEVLVDTVLVAVLALAEQAVTVVQAVEVTVLTVLVEGP